jgi:hypothetical protein
LGSSISARFCQRAAKKRVRANRKTQLVSHHCDISWQKANESLQRRFSILMWEVLDIYIKTGSSGISGICLPLITSAALS